MAIPSIITSGFVKTLSGLGNNSDSIIPLVAKDVISDCALVHTYKKEGGKDDVREKAIEEFGTGALWLFGIPSFRFLIDKTMYPILGLKPELDPRVLNNKNKRFDLLHSFAKEDEKKVFDALGEKTKLFNKINLPFTNKQMYKGVYVAKFLASTLLCAFALTKLIKYKQKTTDERIKKDIDIKRKKLEKNQIFSGSQNIYKNFQDKASNRNISFKGGMAAAVGDFAQDFMFNPLKNTSILDGFIAGTRLKEGRKGERAEIGVKEIFQAVFIYLLAQPIQMAFEFIGKKAGLPIELDPKVIFDPKLQEKLLASVNDIKALKDSNDMLKSIYNLNPKSSLVEILANNGTIPVVKDKKSIKAISTFKPIDENEVKKALSNIESLSSAMSSIKKIKAFKTFAVLGNVAIAICAMGILQPKINIWLRKTLNHGDNRNPAIVQKEKEMEKALA